MAPDRLWEPCRREMGSRSHIDHSVRQTSVDTASRREPLTSHCISLSLCLSLNSGVRIWPLGVSVHRQNSDCGMTVGVGVWVASVLVAMVSLVKKWQQPTSEKQCGLALTH